VDMCTYITRKILELIKYKARNLSIFRALVNNNQRTI